MRSANLLALVGKAHCAGNANRLGKQCNAVQLAREVRPQGICVDSVLHVAPAGLRMTKAARLRLDYEADAKPETHSI